MKVFLPGSYDPFHRGHLDVVEQAQRLFGEVAIGVLVNFAKPSGMFLPDERVALIKASLDPAWNVRVDAFEGLAVDAARDAGADCIVKGLRTAVDFDQEQQMAQMNFSVAGVSTVYVPCSPEFSFVSSRFVREIASHGGDVAHLVPPPVAAALADRFGSPKS